MKILKSDRLLALMLTHFSPDTPSKSHFVLPFLVDQNESLWRLSRSHSCQLPLGQIFNDFALCSPSNEGQLDNLMISHRYVRHFLSQMLSHKVHI